MTRHRTIALFVPHLGCPHRCSFCDQRAISGGQAAPTPADVTAACEQAARQLGAEMATAELGFFGGSFTAVDRAYMVSLLEAAQPFLRSGRLGGIRCSTRPDAIDAPMLDLLRRYGVTAIELGAQSMDDRVLLQNGRGHTAAQVEAAARLIREGGFTLGLQMMVGLDGDTAEGAWETARRLAALYPQEVRIYPTVVLRGTELADRMEHGAYRPLTLEEGVPLAAGLLRFFEEQDIRVIRLGLHASQELEAQLVGGCYHPALRALCQGWLLCQSVEEQLAAQGLTGGPLELLVHPADRSALTGPHRRNLLAWMARGFAPQVREDPAQPRGSVYVSAPALL